MKTLITTSVQIASLALLSSMAAITLAAEDDLLQEFTVQAGGTLFLDSRSGPIEVTPWNEDMVRVEVLNSRGFEVEFEQRGNDVYVEADQEGLFRLRSSNISFNVQVPTNFNLDLDTGGGSIEVGNVNGNITADTSGGSISIGDVESGDVSADTSGGSINIGDIGGDVYADTAGGSITVGETAGDSELDTSGGSIRSGWVGGTLDADTAGGSIRLAGSDQNLVAETAGGSISVERSNGPVDVSTAGGSIDIGPVPGPVKAETSGGSIELTMVASEVGVNADVELDTSGGDVTIHIPANYSATIDAQLRVSRRNRGDYGIFTDFPLTIQDDDNGRIIGRGEINGGGALIELRTSNSDINILLVE